MLPSAYCTLPYNSQDTEPAHVSIHRRMGTMGWSTISLVGTHSELVEKKKNFYMLYTQENFTSVLARFF